MILKPDVIFSLSNEVDVRILRQRPINKECLKPNPYWVFHIQTESLELMSDLLSLICHKFITLIKDGVHDSPVCNLIQDSKKDRYYYTINDGTTPFITIKVMSDSYYFTTYFDITTMTIEYLENSEREIRVLDNGIDIGEPEELTMANTLVDIRHKQLDGFIEEVNKVKEEEFYLEASCHIPFINLNNRRSHPVIRNIHLFRDEHELAMYDDFSLSYLSRVHGYAF